MSLWFANSKDKKNCVVWWNVFVFEICASATIATEVFHSSIYMYLYQRSDHPVPQSDYIAALKPPNDIIDNQRYSEIVSVSLEKNTPTHIIYQVLLGFFQIGLHLREDYFCSTIMI